VPLDRFLYGAVLLVAGSQFEEVAVFDVKNDEMAQDVEQVGRAKHPGYQLELCVGVTDFAEYLFILKTAVGHGFTRI